MLKSNRISVQLYLILFVFALLFLLDRLVITNSPEYYPSFLLTPLNGSKAGLVATREICGEPLEIIERQNDFLVRCGFAFPHHTWIVDKKYLNEFTGLEAG